MTYGQIGLLILVLVIGWMAYRELRDDGYVDMFINWSRRTYRRYSS